MNIVYISMLLGCPWAGPTYSIPAQVAAQTKVDNVFWYNLSRVSDSQWMDSLKKIKDKEAAYHDLDEYPSGRIRDLPYPFCKPDLIIVEQMYKYALLGVRKELVTSEIPYIIIPRGELTRGAQKQKFLKKTIFNALMFSRFTKSAAAIQYLTKQEQVDSTNKWNSCSIVIPNGTFIPQDIALSDKDNNDKIVMVSIGRINKFHKGLDLLLEAAAMIRDILIDNNCIIRIYGPDDMNQYKEMEDFCKDNGLDEIISFNGSVIAEEKKSVLRNSDIFLMPSRFEGHSTGLLEALAYGLPCIATTGSNMREEIENADAGWTADNDAESIKEALIAMISERNRFKEKGRNARKLAEEYDWDALARKTHVIYEELLRKGKQ